MQASKWNVLTPPYMLWGTFGLFFQVLQICVRDMHSMSGHVKHIVAFKRLAVQVVLAAGAVILAAIFVVTSFGGDGPSSSRRPPPAQQVHPCHLLILKSTMPSFSQLWSVLPCNADHSVQILTSFNKALAGLADSTLTVVNYRRGGLGTKRKLIWKSKLKSWAHR